MPTDALQLEPPAQKPREDSGHRSRSIVVVGLAIVVAALFVVFYRGTFVDLEIRWRIDPSSSHGYLIPIAAAWLFHGRWFNTQRINAQKIPKPEFAYGIAALGAGLMLHLVATLTGALSLDGFGLVLAAFGLLWCWGGRAGARTFGAAVLFLIFLVPLPFAWQQPIGEFLQHFVSATSEAALGLCGLVVHREGYMLHLPGHVLEVAQGCSGIRQITVFLGISVFLGLVGGNRIHCATMLAFSIPIAVLANTLRITMTGLITWYLGPEWAAGVLHDFEGLIAVLFGLAMLWWLSNFVTSLLPRANRSASAKSRSDDQVKESTDNNTAAVVGPPSPSRQNRNVGVGISLATRLSMIIVILLPAVFVSSAMQTSLAEIADSPATPLVQSLSSFPETIGDWVGTDTPVARDYFLYGDDHLHRAYVNRKTRQTAILWIIYTEDGRDRGHNPEVCMRSAGCQEALDKRTTVDLPGDGEPADRFYFRQQTGRTGEWVTYWYHVFEPLVDVQKKSSPLKNLVERFQRIRSGVTVELFFSEQTAPDIAAADELARGIESSLKPLLPPETRRSARRKSFLMVTDTVIRDAE